MKRWIVPLSLILLFSSCSNAPQNVENSNTPNAVQPAPAQETQESPVDQKKANYEGFVKANAENLANYAMKLAKSDDLTKEIQALLGDDVPKEIGESIQYRAYLREIYEGRQYTPIFVSGNDIIPAMAPIIEEFHRLPSHGLAKIDASPWNEALKALQDSTPGSHDDFVFTDEERAKLVDLLMEKDVDYTDAQAVKKFVADLVKDENAMTRLHDEVVNRAKQSAISAKQAALVDVRTADLTMQFARAMAFENMTHLTDEEKAIVEKRPTDANYKAISVARTKNWFESLVRVLDTPTARDDKADDKPAEIAQNADETANPDDINDDELDEAGDALAAEKAAANAQKEHIADAHDVKSLLNALYPPHPAYKKLMEARDRYAALEDWKDIPTMSLKKGKPHKGIPALKKRLAAEGYYHGDISEAALTAEGADIYDGDIRAAVRLYHDTHQLAYDENKGIMNSFWESLNTPRVKRLEQIEENLRRWHKTQIIESPYYIFINVPDFHGEVWRDNQMVYRFPVVVGNAKRGCNSQTKQWYFMNATPLQHARMLYIEYNPYWIVPPRIEQEDYIKKINSDPNWLKDHNFEYYTEKGHTVLRQLPGENNALGRVKFIFPNPHSTFLHDSPQKGLFKYPIRAFSHGCMRVWEPLELAKRLLQYDGQWKDRIAKDIEDLQPKRFILKNRFDVFIDYFTVRVDDDGLVYFLADPYRYVRYALEPPKARDLQCTPKQKEWIARNPAQDVRADTDTGVE
ncbi:MAG: L,D-transpeptidase family protein [Proteobacteria bacterium]|nr:L,D-transpeptidase family protein [Pseudomonadota bacterium]